ncbi:MAG: HAD-IC family P-type ATPase [Gammaproteobacteria bacterium]|jgi:Ca2+-transporting ATPase
MHTNNTSSAELIRLAHATRHGRARFEVAGLYRAPRLKKLLEQRLVGISGIQRVNASTLTGRVLLIFSPDVELTEIARYIESLLAETRTPGLKARRTHRLPRYRTSRILHSLSALLGELPALLTRKPSPAYAMTAGLHPDDFQEAPQQEIRPWHLMTLADVLGRLNASGDKGLSREEVETRLQRYGYNSLHASRGRSDLLIFLGQFNSPPVYLLGASAAIAVVTGGMLDAAVILGVVLINSAIGFITERQAEKTIAALTRSGVRSVQVLRDGERIDVEVENIVPGDILLLAPGTYVAADARILNSHRLSVDESALTGESLPVTKDHEYIAREDTPLGDRVNMAYMGTHVSGGNGRAVVVATAAATELGQIQTMVGEAEAPETPMQKQLDRMGTTLALISGGVCAGVFGVGVLRGYAMLEMLKSSVSLAVAAVPEGLPAVATTTLAMGIADMRKHNVAVRHLDAVETLGSVQVFCMDKTGTLTLNRMSVVAVYSGDQAYAICDHKFMTGNSIPVQPGKHEELVRLMQVVALCSDVEITGTPGDWALEGSATEKALVDLALTAGIDVMALRKQCPKLHTRDRAEGRPYMTTLHPYQNGKHLLAVKGSPDEVLEMCTFQIRNGKRVRLTKKARQSITIENERLAGDALRVLGVAYRELDEDRMPGKTGQLVWLGLAGMADPMRTGMDKLIAQFHRAGIETVMITGDQSATAQSIGQQLGLSQGKPLQVLEASKLEDMDPELLAGLVSNVHVFARVSPAHKLKIVQAFQQAGKVVAMTGDGINDGPALKAADIGVAMGCGGTEVAREVSDVVLEDDNLHTMSVAINQGRTIYNNIRKMIHFMISTNLTEIEVMLAGLVLGIGQPMNSMQLLWINLVTDIFPGLALSMEPAEPDIMERPPRDPEEAIIEGRDLKRMAIESGVIGLGTLGAYLFGIQRYGVGPAASTLAFNTLTLNELAHAYSSRSSHRNVFGGSHLRPNPYLTKAILGMGGLQALVSLLPGTRRLLGTTPLGPADLLAIAAGVLLPLIVNEYTKPAPPRDIMLDDGDWSEAPLQEDDEPEIVT